MTATETSWLRMDLGDVYESVKKLDSLTQQCEDLFGKLGNEPRAALFLRSENDGSLHCHTVAYLSPRAVQLLEVDDGTYCAAPQPHSLSLQVGSAEAWALL